MTPTSPDVDYAIREVPRGSAPRTRRVAAAGIDLVVTAVPLLVGWIVVDALREGRGGQADRIVFAATAVTAAAGLWVWNRGVHEGNTGASIGKHLLRLVTRDAVTGAPLGPRRALLPRTGTETVHRVAADTDGFTPIEPDRSLAGIRRRRLVGLAVLLLALLVAALASIAVGARPMDLHAIVHALVGFDGSDTDLIVRTLRIPRTALAIAVGVALGVAGALIQGHTRNPLADAGLLGINAGAALFVVLAIHLLGFATTSEYLWFAFAGSLAASVLVFGISAVGGAASGPLTLALAGAAVAMFLQALTQTVILLDQSTLDDYRFWVVGSVAGHDSEVLWQVLPFLVLGVVIAMANTPSLNVLGLGDDVARGLGTNLMGSRVVGVAAITLLTGAATAACGPIAFVGLVVPHLARMVTGPDHRWLLPYAGLLGAVMVLLADVVGRVVVRPGELQVGIVLAVVGAPFFVAVVRRRTLVSL